MPADKVLPARPPPHLRLYAVAPAMGVLVAMSTLALIEAIAWVQWALLGDSSERHFATLLADAPLWRVLLAPVVGGLLVGGLIRYLPSKRYHGVADVMEACALRGGRMDTRSSVAAAAAAAVSIGSGASVGREGPAVHIGASICSWLAEKVGLSRRHSLVLLGCGAAAAVTASFNAPIAGVLFALEVVVGYYTLRVFAPIVLASMGALVVSRAIHGNGPAFNIPLHGVESLWELPLFAVLGVLTALVVVLTISSVGRVQRVHSALNIPIWLRPAVGGLCISGVALLTPYALGVGYQTIDLSLNEAFSLAFLLGILLAKVVATAISLGSGFCGGVFGPSLVLGALVGAALGQMLELVLPGQVSSPTVYALAGMAASASAMLGAPISTVIIVFELSNDYNAIAAVMLASATASTAMMYQPYSSFFRWQLGNRGVNIVAGRDQSLMRTETIDALVKPHFTKVDSNEHVRSALAKCAKEQRDVLVAVDEHAQLVGSMTVLELVSELSVHEELGQFTHYAHDNSMSLLAGSSLNGALDMMSSHKTDYLPVVKSEGRGKKRTLVGVVFQTDVLRKYNRMLEEAREHEFGVN